jgi:vacuolar protein sorting-associated protein 26
VRIKLKNMELEIRRRESTGSGTNMYVETETLAKFELMDGVPIRGLQLLFTAFLVSSFGKMSIV